MKPFQIGFVVFALLFTFPVFAQTDLPLLEEYAFEMGDSGITEFLFHDGNLGRGIAQFRIHITRRNAPQSDLRIEVFQHHREDTVSFALLLERVELVFADTNGAVVKSIVLDRILGPDGLFIIGDSNDGYFQHVAQLGDISRARSLRIRLHGNYE